RSHLDAVRREDRRERDGAGGAGLAAPGAARVRRDLRAGRRRGARMRRSWASVTVGVLVLVVATVTYLLVRSTHERSSATSGYKVWALFRDASGLFEKSRVQTAGISVGQIEKRELDQATGKAKIWIRINPGITLYENAEVAKKSASLLGEYYLEIAFGTETKMVDGRKQTMRKLGNNDEIKIVIEPIGIG